MPLHTAIEDLKTNTLRSVSGILSRLEYLAGLRKPPGPYNHWGLSRTYGETQAQQALGEAHRTAVSGVLRTPLQRLLTEVDLSSQAKGMPPIEYVEELSGKSNELLPEQRGAGSARHLSAVLHALLSLLRSE
jgi:hypothetical protein